LQSLQKVCDRNMLSPQIQVLVLNADGAFQSVTPLRSEECAIAEGGVYPGSILLRFEEP
jgi:hypothetical protein